ncbi:hypothetical protein COCON_G00010690 [Conger conger]|uniref:Cadherin domain-containing protein n=1 Tax=Conger conger TaxID=82655 RepID=A0A9Q1E2F8_CONCO|nr:cadherin-17 [Conger conger]KAJ8288410.1 hypothetical protein COCON_G00010690 [Conger conger]
MLPTSYLMALALLIGRAVGEGWEDRIGAMGDMVLGVPEGTEVPYPIFQFKSAHPEVVSYSMTGETNGKMAISNEGWLYLVEPLNWAEESIYNVQLEAHSDTEIVDGPCSVTINVRDINNHAPVFSQTEYHGEVMERSRAGETFLRVSATDLDNPDTPNGRLSYSIVNQIPDRLKKPLFQINSITGEISITPDGEEHLRAREGIQYGMEEDPEGSVDHLKRKFDEYCPQSSNVPYELNPFYTCVERSASMRMNPEDDPDYTLIVRVQDLEGASENAFSANAKATITVKQNLWRSPGPIRIREHLEAEYPKKIAQVQSNNPGALYTLGEKERFPKFPFSINEGGEIFVTESLDREEKDMYVLVVFAKDGEGTTLDRPMEIPIIVEDVNDNPPMCEESERVLEVQENEPLGSQIGAIGGYDLDEENSVNSLLSYQLLTHEPTSSSGPVFRVDGLSGNIQVASILPKRTEIPEYHLTVQVSDQGGAEAGLSNTCKIVIKVIDINNEIPVFEKNDYGSVATPEDSPPGTTLLTVLATDADDPGTGSSQVEYHITDGNQDGIFSIDAEGHIRVAKPLDFESKSTYRLQIDATNPEPLIPGVKYDSSSTAFVSIEVTNVDELPEFDTDIFEVSVPENATVGVAVVKMDAKDPEGGEIRYKLEGDENNWLEINEETGEIKTKGKLDHEEVAVINVKVTAYEKASPENAVEKDVTVRILDVNDNVPKLKENQGFMCKKKLTPVFIYAEDKDSPPFGKPFTFVITQPRKYPNWQIEDVDGTSAKLVLKKAPEEDKTFSLPINVKDSAGVGVSHAFQVRVCNCTELGYCYIEPGRHGFKYDLPTTVGILGGTLAFIAVILIIAVHRSNKNQKKLAKETEDTDAML